MKIEKLNDRQLRFTLTREDLEARKIRLSELAYGSDKVRSLFREMMQQAMDDFGFEVSNSPLMIEAVPLSSESIVVIVTKVEDPEELDSRYARFSQEDGSLKSGHSTSTETLTGADDILGLISRLRAARKEAAQKAEDADEKENRAEDAAAKSDAGENDGKAEASGEDEIYRLTRFFLFHDMDMAVRAAGMCDPAFTGISTLYKNPDDGNYYLILQKADSSPELFNKLCNVLSEFSMQVEYTSGMSAFFGEHMVTLIKGNALEVLASL